MKSLKEIFEETRKIIPTDKNDDYLEFYDEIFSPLRGKKLNILELGVYDGGSLIGWANFFPKARIIGVDVRKPSEPLFEYLKNTNLDRRVFIHIASQDDREFLWRMLTDQLGEG